MPANREPAPVQRTNLVPRHQWMTEPLLPVPPGNDVRADPVADDEERRWQRQPFQYGHRIFEVVPVAVVERDRELVLEGAAGGELVDDRGQWNHAEVAREKPAIAGEGLDTHRQAVIFGRVADPV